MLKIQKGSSKKAGRWFWLYWVWPRYRKQVVITCPKCKAEIRLNGYKITRTGEVEPDVEHSCGFSDTIKLLDYDNDRN